MMTEIQDKIQEFRTLVLQWYENHGRGFPWREESATIYLQVISEILLQRTRAETVAEFIEKFKGVYPSWKLLDKASITELAKVLQPIGLWNRRSATLKRLAAEMVKRGGVFPEDRQELEQLPGVGQYVANAILLLDKGQPQPLLDVNMARVLERFFGPRKRADIRHDPYLQDLATSVVHCDRAKELNWAVLDFAAQICRARNPFCKECPLRSTCSFFQEAKSL